MNDPGHRRTGWWTELERDDSEDATAAAQQRRVADVLIDELDADEIHGLTVTQRRGETFYLVVSSSTTWDQIDDDVDHSIPVLDLRTAVVDLEDDQVTISDNGIWVPQEADVTEQLTKLLARTTTDLSSGESAGPPAAHSAIDVDPDLLLEREIETDDSPDGQAVDKMDRHTGIDPARSWGYGAGPPPEIDRVVDRLEEADLNPADHTTRLVWGKKEPMTRNPRPIDDLMGNYGIELQPRGYGLIAIDVDYPDEFPDSELPETLEVSSPHGDDEQRHILLRCDEKRDVAEALGGWAIQSVSWGDLWIGDRYVVGPGSQLSEYGCDDGDHQRGEAGGCDACEDPDGGYYEILEDRPIAEVDADTILDLVDDSEGYEIRDRRADPDPPESDDENDTIEDIDPRPTCDSCGEHRDDDALKTLEVVGETRRICRGGCN